jgi:phosphate-selective porin OprO/OprP
MQGKRALQLAAANGPDLSSGSNFRRAQLGIQGTLFGDWSYFFNYEFGSGVSSGNELQGRIQQAYVEYDGLAPWSFRVGAFPPSVGLEDSTGSADTIFFERNSPSDILRNLAGGDGRDGIAVTYAADRLFGQFAVTGGKTADTTLAFDEQQAVVGRVAGVIYADNDTRVVLGAAASDILHAPDATAGANSARNVTLQDPPELTIDDQSTKLVTTGAIDASNAWGYGLEGAVQWRSLFAQGGYFGYGITPRNSALPALNFNGWYTQATWVLTGESKGYSSSTAAFTAPKPRIPFSFDGGGPGAWEIAARYSDLDLNDDAGILGGALPTGGVRGGEQQIATVAINWYPVSALKFSLQAQNVHISRIGTIPAGFGHGTLSNAFVGQAFDTIAFRSQLSL